MKKTLAQIKNEFEENLKNNFDGNVSEKDKNSILSVCNNYINSAIDIKSSCDFNDYSEEDQNWIENNSSYLNENNYEPYEYGFFLSDIKNLEIPEGVKKDFNYAIDNGFTEILFYIE